MRKKESGNAIDLLSSLVVLLFVMTLLLSFIGFSKLVQIRLECDTIARMYLYRMESTGYLTDGDYQQMKDDFAAIDVTVSENHSTVNQVAYGQVLTLDILVTFDNPLHDFLNPANTFINTAFDEILNYHIQLEATAKW